MKKFLILVLAVCMMMSAAVAENANVLNWETVVPILEAGNVTGQFYTFEE